jgi:hypothetical protein
LKRLERTDARGRDLQGHLARIDRRDLLARHVANLCGLLGRQRQAVKDVALLIAFNLRDRANDDAIRGDHVPPLPNLQPRDRISHRRHCFGHRALSRSSASSAIEGTRSWGGPVCGNVTLKQNLAALEIALSDDEFEALR